MRKGEVRRQARSFAGAILVALLLRAFVVQAYSIPSGSMVPTLQVGDRIFVEKLSYKVRAPRRGEIVVFEHPKEPDKDLIKRVVAVAGDTVELKDGLVYVNGVAASRTPQVGDCDYWDQDENTEVWQHFGCRAFTESLDGKNFTTLSASNGVASPPVTVPEGRLFVLGDNRDRSSDSRYWGFVPLDHVRGRAVVVWWSSGSPDGIRWGRFGQLLH